MKTPRQIIAEACGWKLHSRYWEHASTGRSTRIHLNCQDRDCESIFCGCSVPNYVGDLNAMAEAEQILTPAQREKYLLLLDEHTQGKAAFAPVGTRAFCFISVLP